MSVLVVGSLNMDLVVTMSNFPDSGQTVIADKFTTIPGGKGLNQAIAASKAGAQVSMLGCLGNDDYSRDLENTLKEFQVDSSNLQKVEGSCGIALVEVEESGSNRISIVAGANAKFSYTEIKPQFFVGNKYSVLLAPLENPITEIEKTFRTAKNLGAITILNPAPSQQLSLEFLSVTDILIPNQHEAEALTGVKISNKADAISAAHRLLDTGSKMIIITLGDKGALMVSAQETFFQEAFEVKAIDTTAAGDTFCGVFAAEIDRMVEPRQALKTASVAAALSTTKFGASTSIPSQKEINEFAELCKK